MDNVYFVQEAMVHRVLIAVSHKCACMMKLEEVRDTEIQAVYR